MDLFDDTADILACLEIKTQTFPFRHSRGFKGINHPRQFDIFLTFVKVNRTYMRILDVAMFNCISLDVCDPLITSFLRKVFR